MSRVETYATAALVEDALRGQRLPGWAAPAAAGLAVMTALLLAVATPVDGVAGTAVVAVLLFVGLQTAWSVRVEGRRHAVDRLATTAVHAAFLAAVLPLLSVLVTLIAKGIRAMSGEFLTTSMRGVSPTSAGGGLYHALIGTLEQVGIAVLLAIPLGVLAAIYLVEYGQHAGHRGFARAVGFVVDVMTGVPSVVVGLFVYTALVLTLGLGRSGLAASVALTILMLPMVVRSCEEMLRVVPDELREASYALGVPRWRTIVRVVVPTAMGGIVTGAMLAVARAAGETAPLLLTTFLSKSVNADPTNGPQAALPTFLWDQIASSTPASVDRAWGAALVLVLVVTALYLTARILARTTGVKR